MLSSALWLCHGGAGQEPCPVILPHMSSSAQPQGFCASAFFSSRAQGPGWAHETAPGCGGSGHVPCARGALAPCASATSVPQPRVAVPSRAGPESPQGPRAGILGRVCPLLRAAMPWARWGELGTPPVGTCARHGWGSAARLKSLEQVGAGIVPRFVILWGIYPSFLSSPFPAQPRHSHKS